MITHEVSGTIISDATVYEALDAITSSVINLPLIEFLGEAERLVGIHGITFSLGGVSIYFSKNGVKFSYMQVFE
jgi:hypothetical protein